MIGIGICFVVALMATLWFKFYRGLGTTASDSSEDGLQFMLGPGWPQFWIMTMLASFSETMCLTLAPGLAYAQLNGGHDPCHPGTEHFDEPFCRATTVKFAGILALWSGIHLLLA